MSLFLRLFWVLWCATRKSKLRPLDHSIVHFRVWPTDLDLNRHMNNGRYLTIMDLGRLDLLARTGLVRLARINKWVPIVGFVSVRFRRPLHLFQAYELHTWITHWDEKWFYVRQEFRIGQQIYASAWLKGLLRHRRGPIAPREILAAIGFNIACPRPVDQDVWDGLTATVQPEAKDIYPSVSPQPP